MIDWIVFYAVSTIVQPYNGGDNDRVCDSYKPVCAINLACVTINRKVKKKHINLHNETSATQFSFPDKANVKAIKAYR